MVAIESGSASCKVSVFSPLCYLSGFMFYFCGLNKTFFFGSMTYSYLIECIFL